MKHKIFSVFIFLIITSLIVLAIFLLNSYKPTEKAIETISSGINTSIDENDWIIFDEPDRESKAGIIFYPGARVEAIAYAPLAQELADVGYQIIIVPMPINLAVFGVNKADQVMASYQEIDKWVISGHSLGGAMAARYAKKIQRNWKHCYYWHRIQLTVMTFQIKI